MSNNTSILPPVKKDNGPAESALQFRELISKTPGSRFLAEANRYHLYVSLACPWAQRTLIARALKGLTSLVSVSVVYWHMDGKGWRFPSDKELEQADLANENIGTKDHLYGASRIRELYDRADSHYKGRYSVPVLWDKKLHTIVSNESGDILRMFNSEFDELIDSKHPNIDLYPKELQGKIDDDNAWILHGISNGVARAGFATVQEIYEKEARSVFEHLDRVENLLKENRKIDPNPGFLLPEQLTEADIRLFVTIVRFDPVYHQHFKCNWKSIRHDYPMIHDWLRFLYWKVPGFKETTDFEHIKKGQTKSQVAINPHGITPIGPKDDILPL